MKKDQFCAFFVGAILLAAGSASRVAGEPLRPLESISSSNGVLQADLVIKNINTDINGHHVHDLRTYNGSYPGPTLHAHPGDTMNVRYINRLRADTNHPAPLGTHGHSIDNVNLHTHGLNVSPEGYSDNVYLDILPGQWVPFEFHIPANHPTGLFWYHPHRHGGVSTQLGSALSGNIILTGKGDLDEIPEIAAAKKVEILFNEVPLMPAISKTNEDHEEHWVVAESANDAASVGEGRGVPDSLRIFLVNGAPVLERKATSTVTTLEPPSITMAPGEVRRFQVTHAGLDAFLNLVLIETQTNVRHPLHLISYDGITISNLVSSTEPLLLGDGNRAEFLFKAGPRSGNYVLKSIPNDAQVPPSGPGGIPIPDPDIPLLLIIATNQPALNMALPSKLNPPTGRLPDIKDQEIVRKRTLGFDVNANPTNRFALLFLVDGQPFDPYAANQTMLLDTAEEWRISSDSDIGLNWAHPFHIHVNWFQVVKINDQPVTPRWQDTVVIPHHGSVTIRHRFQQFAGRFVLHCHILPHEDEGMMQGVEVVDPKNLNFLQAWRMTNFNSFENLGISADYPTNSTDLPNIFKYAFGVSAFHQPGLPASTLVQAGGKDYLGVRFNWRVPPGGIRNPVNYAVSASTDLVSWRAITNTAPGIDNGSGFASLLVRDDAPFDGRKQFISVKLLTEPAALPIVSGLPE